MNFPDPAVWGPILITLVIYLGIKSLEDLFRVNANRGLTHMEDILMRLEEIERRLSDIHVSLDAIQSNTQTGENWD